jgi:hypothetical protein
MLNVFRAAPKRTWSQSRDSPVHFRDDFREARSLGGREVEHFEALGFEANLFENLLGAFDAASRSEVAFLEMAPAFEAAGHYHAIDAAFKSGKQVIDFNLARAGQAQYAHGTGIL